MASYVRPSCDIDFGNPQGLAIHEELGCEWGDDEDGSANELNDRPRAALGFYAPREILDKLLNDSVVSTP